jgi:hypothetical protein
MMGTPKESLSWPSAPPGSTEARTVAELIESIAQAGEAYAAFIENLSDAAFQRRPAPEEWSAAEITGHLAEFPLSKAEQVRQVAANPGLAVGRPRDDPDRVAALARLAESCPLEAAAAVRATVRKALTTLRDISPEGWSATAAHSRMGTVTVRAMMQRSLHHMREHLEQARRAAGAVSDDR